MAHAEMILKTRQLANLFDVLVGTRDASVLVTELVGHEGHPSARSSEPID